MPRSQYSFSASGRSSPATRSATVAPALVVKTGPCTVERMVRSSVFIEPSAWRILKLAWRVSNFFTWPSNI